MKFQRCDKCGKERPVEKDSNSKDYDQVGFIYLYKIQSAEYFDVCPECQAIVRAMFPAPKIGSLNRQKTSQTHGEEFYSEIGRKGGKIGGPRDGQRV